MGVIRNILILIFISLAFIEILWMVAIPPEFLSDQIQRALQKDQNILITMDEIEKGFPLNLKIREVRLFVNNIHALSIEDLSIIPDLSSIIRKAIGFKIDGTLSGGRLYGIVDYPLRGALTLRGAMLGRLPVIEGYGLNIKGTLSSDIKIKGQRMDISFEIPDLDLKEMGLSGLPFINSFHRVRGVITVEGDTINVRSVGLEGEKGYARLSGRIINNRPDLRLEFMPVKDTLTPFEEMLLGRYIESPGYYVIPINEDGRWKMEDKKWIKK